VWANILGRRLTESSPETRSERLRTPAVAGTGADCGRRRTGQQTVGGTADGDRAVATAIHRCRTLLPGTSGGCHSGTGRGRARWQRRRQSGQAVGVGSRSGDPRRLHVCGETRVNIERLSQATGVTPAARLVGESAKAGSLPMTAGNDGSAEPGKVSSSALVAVRQDPGAYPASCLR
jgi:hypothetical protein